MADTLFQPLTRDQLLTQPPVFQPPQLSQPIPRIEDVTGAGINPGLFGGTGAAPIAADKREADFDYITKLNRNAEQQTQEQNSFLPNALAIGALLTGDVKPMMMLQEQKRKTAMGAIASPYLMESTRLSHEGKRDEAAMVLDNAIKAVGDRSPEMLNIIGEQRKAIGADEAKWNDVQKAHEYLVAMTNENSHPDLIKLRDFMGKAVKSRSLMSGQLLQSMMQKSFPEAQVNNNQVVYKSPFGGPVVAQNVPTIAQPSDTGGPVGELLAKQLNITTSDLTNIVNLKPGTDVQLSGGGTVTAGSPEHLSVVQAFKDTQAARANVVLGEKTPIQPEVAQELIKFGFTPLQIATRNFPQDKMNQAILNKQANAVGVSAASALAAIEQNPFAAAQYGVLYLDPKTKLPIRTAESLKDLRARGITPILMKEDVFNNMYQPSVEALKIFDQFDPYLQALGDPKTREQRGASYLNRLASDWLGIAVTPGQETAKTFEVMLGNAIEQFATRNKISHDDPQIMRLKKMVIGKGADPDEARKAIVEIKTALTNRLHLVVGEESLLSAPPVGQTLTQPATGQTAPMPTIAPGPNPNAILTQKGRIPKGAASQRANEQAQEVLGGATPTPTAPATPATPATPYKYLKPGSLK